MPPTIAELALDATGTSESRTGEWSFANFPEIVGGDTLSGAPVPVLTILSPPGAVSLTVGSALINGSGVYFPLSVTGGTAGSVYKTACRAVTTGGKTLICFGDIVLIGPR